MKPDSRNMDLNKRWWHLEVPSDVFPKVLMEMGVELKDPPEDINDKLTLLDRVNELFCKITEKPSLPVHCALVPATQELISDKLLGNPNESVRVSTLSCIHELLRILAPGVPYDNDDIKKIIHQTVKAFEHLSLISGRCYEKARAILYTVAKTNTRRILLDLTYAPLVAQMFKIFLGNMRLVVPEETVANMEEVMTLLIKEIDGVPVEILSLLLIRTSAAIEDNSPPSRNLGMKVVRNCSEKLKPFLQGEIEELNQVAHTLTVLSSSIWPDTPTPTEVWSEGGDASYTEPALGNGAAEHTDQSAIPHSSQMVIDLVSGSSTPAEVWSEGGDASYTEPELGNGAAEQTDQSSQMVIDLVSRSSTPAEVSLEREEVTSHIEPTVRRSSRLLEKRLKELAPVEPDTEQPPPKRLKVERKRKKNDGGITFGYCIMRCR